MDININTDNMKVTVSKFGAELKSLIFNDKEYIWNEKEIWAKSSPILFPFIGKLKDNEYIYQSKTYKLDTRHGFARDMDFDLISHTKNMIILELKSSEETKKVYPFDFKFQLKYEIVENNSLEMTFSVINTGKDIMYFSLGAHPAIKLSNDYENWSIKLDSIKDLYKYGLDNGFYTNDKIFIDKNDTVKIKDELFKDDAIIFDNITSKSIIENINSNTYLEIVHSGFQYIAYWRPQKARFICVEPWFGITDNINHDKKLENKNGIKKLNANERFDASILFTIKEKVE